MIRLTTQEVKQIEKLKKKVHKQYPGAYLAELGSGYYTILQEQDDLLPKDVLQEWCVPPAKHPVKAWEAASAGAKVDQNLNRTHPLRIEGMNLEDKIARVEARRLRTETAKESRKSKEYGIYI